MIIECRDLGYRYGDVVAVAGLTFTMGEGEFLGILGANGAGKSTTLHMLSTLLPPSRGVARVLGRDLVCEPEAIRAGIGMVFQESALDERLTAPENLAIHAVLHGIPARIRAARVDEALEWAGLAGAGGRLVRTFSGGMRRRLELARALMHRPRLLLLDEPTLGLDPQGRRDLWDRIDALQAEGMSVLMNTHNLQEAEACTRVGIMDRGRLVALGEPAALKHELAEHREASLEDVVIGLTGGPLSEDSARARRIVPYRKRAPAL